MRLQGGLVPVDGIAAGVVEIACDESGFTGTNLLHPSSPVLVHASVDLRADEAADLMRTLRSGFRLSPNELKSAQFLRGARSTELRHWFLSTLAGRAHVQLVDKKLYLATRIVEVFLTERRAAARVRPTDELRLAAGTLWRAGETAAGRDWDEFLAAGLDVLRTKRTRRTDDDGVERFIRARDALTANRLEDGARALLGRLTSVGVTRRLAILAEDDLAVPPPLEPMLPALAATVLFWSHGHRPVLVVHDEQSALTARRLRWLRHALAEDAGQEVSPLVGLVTVDSRDDPRVQVADLLAGLARRAHERDDEDDLLPFLAGT